MYFLLRETKSDEGKDVHSLLIGLLTYTTDRTEYFDPLNFRTEPNQKAIEDRTRPY